MSSFSPQRLQTKNPLETPIRFVKGVGPNLANILKRLGIETVQGLLWHVPRRYEDRSHLRRICDVTVGEVETVTGTIRTMSSRSPKKRLSLFQLTVTDGSGVIYATWFNQPYLKKYFKVGQQVVMHGKIDQFRGMRQIVTPEHEVLSDAADLSVHMGRIVPIYPLTQDLNQRYLRSLMYRALKKYVEYVREPLPPDMRDRLGLLPLAQALAYVHFPPDDEHACLARERLVFDELFGLQMALSIRQSQQKTESDGIVHDCDGLLVRAFEKRLPFTLTNDQSRVKDEIFSDMSSSKRMNRLLHGDVGSGKTIMAIYALLVTMQNGFQGALMAPTEILAEQHYLTLKEFLAGVDVKIVLLKGAATAKQRKVIYKQIERHEVDLVVGTHAIIQDDVIFKRLGCVVIDEQHKFGVMQRAMLQRKGGHPDVLIMTATPIPRTLALTVYGDLDVSTIRELPPGRGAIITKHIGEKQRKSLYTNIIKTVASGAQVYIVYPLVDESEKLDLKAATTMYDHLSRDIFPQCRVGLLHGKLAPEEKDAIMHAFKQKELDILVATIVIEVGIDVPNATMMVIEDAHRFGLAQLHQLRGRVGRGSRDSHCILVSNMLSPEARARLGAMVQTNDGFEIAEEDLKLRGPGEFFGTRQHGLPELKIANLIGDRAILEMARREAFALIQDDPHLEWPEHRELAAALRAAYQPLGFSLINIS